MLRVEGDSVLITFSRKFYSEDAVRMAISDFSESCDSALDCNKPKLEVRLTPKDSMDIDLERLGLEFANYCFGLTK